MVTLRQLARAVNLSVATVSRALRGDPAVKEETQRVVRAKARELGYEVNPYYGQLMSSLRRRQNSTFKGNLGLIWFDQLPDAKNTPSLVQIQKGVITRAHELGYQVSEFCRLEQSPDALRRILRNRGIRGVVFSPPSYSPGKVDLRVDFAEFTCIALGWGILHPAMHTVRFDYHQAMQLALHHANRSFGKGVATIWDVKTDRRADHVIKGTFLARHLAGPAIGSRLFIDSSRMREKDLVRLMQRYAVRCVISESRVSLPQWLYQHIAPANIIWFRDPGEEKGFGWIDLQYSLMGDWGVELLVSKLQRNEYGLPPVSQTLLVPPQWIATEKSSG